MDHGWDDANLHFSPIIPPRCKIPLEPSSTAMGGCCMQPEASIHALESKPVLTFLGSEIYILCYEKVPNINKYVII